MSDQAAMRELDITPEELEIRQRLKDDFSHYSARALSIRTKIGEVDRFHLNSVQRLVHDAAAQQEAETGRVRLIILKARQTGISTYVEGRFYWKVTHRKGVRAFILTHSDAATSNLFALARRYHDYCPSLLKPQTRTANARELDFGLLQSGYRVGTAKSAGVGRSDTVQYFHGSECAFWPGAEEQASGALQAIPDEPGTEIWLESTANGMGGLFHGMWVAAQRGESAFRAVFIPWFAHDEYVADPPEGWSPSDEVAAYAELHGLGRAQTFWMASKNAELASGDNLPTDQICWRFRREYPATAEEAFSAGQEGAYIRGDLLTKARQFKCDDQSALPLVIGCDFARSEDGDANVFISRRGRSLGHEVYERFHSEDTVQIANALARIIDAREPSMCFLDSGGGGAQVYDILRNRNYGDVLTLVNFGSAADDPRRFANKRAEMWGLSRDWLTDPGGADMVDDDTLHMEATSTGAKENVNQQLIMEPKKDVKKRVGFSPDGWDAVVLTFAGTVRSGEDQQRRRGRPPGKPGKANSRYNPLRRWGNRRKR